MEENQALLGRDCDGRLMRPQQQKQRHFRYEERRSSSSEESEGWWADSHSSCSSSCSGSTGSVSSVEWESKVDSNGELFFIEELERSKGDTAGDVVVPDDKDSPHKPESPKTGKLMRWMRRRESKRLRPKLSLVSEESMKQRPRVQSGGSRVTFREAVDEDSMVVLRVERLDGGETWAERVLGVTVTCWQAAAGATVVISHVHGGPAAEHRSRLLGRCVLRVNSQEVTWHNWDSTLAALVLPSEVTLKLRKVSGKDEGRPRERPHVEETVARALTERNDLLEATLEDQLVGVAFVNLDPVDSDGNDLVYSYPGKNMLSSSRGSFVTLFHLLSEVNGGTNPCVSSSVTAKQHLGHVLYATEGKCLLLLLVPDTRCSVKEANEITADLVRCLSFNHQSLIRCFTTVPAGSLNHFFSLFFSRLLTSGYSCDSPQRTMLESIPTHAQERSPAQFEEILPAATWVPLPKEAQLQLDDALNELEANDFEQEGEEGIESQRRYTILSSCLYHRGWLLASHHSKQDLLDVHSFCRQNGLLHLLHSESVRSLVIWKEVFPLSVNRALPSRKTSVYPTPNGRWFMLIVGQRSDMLVVLLEAGSFCVKLEGHPGPGVEYVEEAQDTLRHIQRLGITSMTSQWISDNVRAKTVGMEEISGRGSRRKENLLAFVRSVDAAAKPTGSSISPSSTGRSPEGLSTSKLRGGQDRWVQEGSEDSVSQATSNVSEVSDENAPILGRRAERGRAMAHVAHVSDESDDSDSDWESYRESTASNGNDSSFSAGGYLGGIQDVIPTKLTTGPHNVLFHYIHLEGSEGVLMSATLNAQHMTATMKEILNNFRKTAQVIHALLENNIRFKKTSQEDPKSLINKSLIAVKEHGILLEHTSTESETKKAVSTSYWVVGRLFFTPQPREVYVCYHDDAPQNLVEIAFRLGLSAAG